MSTTPCPQCGTTMPVEAAFCPHCGLRMFVPGGGPGAAGRFKDNLLAALAYFTFVPAVVLLLLEPFNRNRFVRFHALQSLLLTGAVVVMGLALRVLFALLGLIPVLGYLLGWLSLAITAMGVVILWIVLLIKALQGERLKLPWIGNWADAA